ncbi:response regulator [Ruminococcaceae bacterium OttesenSCG-928-A16]|nr:response regulator [Ruminococcaceae bacterium OttesenSCG-928-A16]
MVKVVVVEDEALVRKGIVLAINWAQLGCVVVGEAENGLAGLQIIKRLAPDIVITDMKMPQMDGVQMLAQLAQNGIQVEAIILSAHSDFSYAQSAVKLGVVDYVLKPFADGELEAAVEKAKSRLPKQHNPPTQQDILSFQIKKGDKSRYVAMAMDCIAQQYGQPGISVASVAEELAISEGYLSRVFKKETNHTFNNYLTRYRMHKAMQLLKDCRLKVYEVADAVGYQDTTYFSTLFKKLTGLSPSEYQASGQ